MICKISGCLWQRSKHIRKDRSGGGFEQCWKCCLSLLWGGLCDLGFEHMTSDDAVSTGTKNVKIRPKKVKNRKKMNTSAQCVNTLLQYVAQGSFEYNECDIKPVSQVSVKWRASPNVVYIQNVISELLHSLVWSEGSHRILFIHIEFDIKPITQVSVKWRTSPNIVYTP